MITTFGFKIELRTDFLQPLFSTINQSVYLFVHAVVPNAKQKKSTDS